MARTLFIYSGWRLAGEAQRARCLLKSQPQRAPTARCPAHSPFALWQRARARRAGALRGRPTSQMATRPPSRCFVPKNIKANYKLLLRNKSSSVENGIAIILTKFRLAGSLTRLLAGGGATNLALSRPFPAEQGEWRQFENNWRGCARPLARQICFLFVRPSGWLAGWPV